MPDGPSNPESTSPKLKVASAGDAISPPLDYAPAHHTPNRLVAWFRGWSHEHFTAERVGGFFKSLLWVAPLTLLIWIYAERQQQVRQENVSLPVEVHIRGDSGKVVSIIGDPNVLVTVKGPKAAIDKINMLFSPLSGNPPVRIELEGASGEGLQTIRAVRVGEDKRFVDAGITVISAEPKELRILIDPLVDRDVPVELRPEQRQRLVKQPVFNPPTVKVRGPKSVLREQSDAGRLVAYVDLDLEKMPSVSEKAIQLENVKLTLPFQHKYVGALNPPVVSVVVEPTPPTEYTFPSVRTALVVSDPLFNKYEIRAEQENLFNVKVSGPQQLIEPLQQAGTAPRAFLELPATDPGPGSIDATVRYDFPPGVTVKEGPMTVKVTLSLR